MLERQLNFITNIIDEDIASDKYAGRVVTRFPPEPNGYLHIGHAKSICLNFGIAESYANGQCNLRFDDTNPAKEEDEYVNSIIDDVRWLGFTWHDSPCFASDYFPGMYNAAVELIKKGKAYVDDLSSEEIRAYRGTLTEAGKESPSRARSIEENLELFEQMKQGRFRNGEKVLRAKIDMASPNINMRDPVMYRILHSLHHRSGDSWCIYPMYDFAHCLEDSFEKITHSICTLEFEDHRPLYDWFLEELGYYRPRQIEFARLNLTYTVMSKRCLLKLVTDAHVEGWDDPRMPTISGFRKRGYTPESIRKFCDIIGVAKSNSTVDVALLEHCIREELNISAPRVMAVLDPLKVVIDNYEFGKTEELEAENNPEDSTMGTRKIKFSKVIYIERADFMEEPPKKYYRLAPGNEVRLKHAYYITCKDVIKDKNTGEILEIHCEYDPATRGGWSEDGRKVRGTIHWVSEESAVTCEVRLFEHLFSKPDPFDVEEGQDFTANINIGSKKVIMDCKLESSLKEAEAGSRYQFLRNGYFIADKVSAEGAPVFNRIISLKDSWAKELKKKS